VRALFGEGEPRPSIIGIVLAAVSLVVMPLLSWAQRRTGRELESRSAVADYKQTLLCTYLSAVLLVGLGLNSLFGWSWADPIAGLVIAAVAVREGLEAWKGRNCCGPSPLDATTCESTHGARIRHEKRKNPLATVAGKVRCYPTLRGRWRASAASRWLADLSGSLNEFLDRHDCHASHPRDLVGGHAPSRHGLNREHRVLAASRAALVGLGVQVGESGLEP
jgi:hypothetical protein